jgi:hypothetical protein
MTTRSIQKTIILLKQSNAIYLVSPFINLSTVKISAAVSLSSGNVADAITTKASHRKCDRNGQVKKGRSRPKLCAVEQSDRLELS